VSRKKVAAAVTFVALQVLPALLDDLLQGQQCCERGVLGMVLVLTSLMHLLLLLLLLLLTAVG
jgi:hypothetical protein